MRNKDYTLAGWISIVNAALTLPLTFLATFFLFTEGEFKILEIILLTISLGLFVYMNLSFKELLNINFNFYEVNTFIDLLVVGNILLVVLSIFSSTIGMILGTILSIPLGVIYVIIFIKLLNLKEDLYGYLKPLAYASIGTGILVASVILSGIAFIPSMVADVILGMVFFKASK